MLYEATSFECSRIAQDLQIRKVQVESVQMLNRPGKVKRFGRAMGRRKDTRRAYVSLKPGQEINFGGEA